VSLLQLFEKRNEGDNEKLNSRRPSSAPSSSEWLESKQSTWRKYHKLGWIGAIIVIAA